MSMISNRCTRLPENAWLAIAGAAAVLWALGWAIAGSAVALVGLVLSLFVLTFLGGLRLLLATVLLGRVSLVALEGVTALELGGVSGLDAVILVDLGLIAAAVVVVLLRPHQLIILPVLRLAYPLILITFTIGLLLSPLVSFCPLSCAFWPLWPLICSSSTVSTMRPMRRAGLVLSCSP